MLCEHQLEMRKSRISASDIGAILGVNPWKNAADVQAEKLFGMRDDESSEPLEIGNMLERPLLEWGARKIGVELQTPPNCRTCNTAHMPTMVDEQYDWLCATPDALVIGRNVGMEAKTAGIVRGYADNEEWGQEGTAEIPATYLAQILAQMRVCHLNYVVVPTMLAGRGRVLYEVERDNREIETLIQILADWREKHLVQAMPVDYVTPSISTLKRIVRTPAKVARVAMELHEHLVSAKAALKKAEEEEEKAREAYLQAIGDAEAGTCELGSFTYFRQSRKGVDSKKLLDEYPDVFEAVQRVSEFPVLRFTKKTLK